VYVVLFKRYWAMWARVLPQPPARSITRSCGRAAPAAICGWSRSAGVSLSGVAPVTAVTARMRVVVVAIAAF
jgi:hypothetical protein